MSKHLFTSESVSEGHPDKIADQVSDAILDHILSKDPQAKVAVETLITNNYALIAGEVSTLIPNEEQDFTGMARDVLKRIGYDDLLKGFNYKTAEFESRIHVQSPEINRSVTLGGAGDQGLMFGYACKETPELMPLPVTLSHQIMRRLSELRHNKTIGWLQPDAKSQVTVRYANGKPDGIETVVVSTQHSDWVKQEEIRETVIRDVILPVIAPYMSGAEPKYIINPSGSFIIGGPYGDTGLTGRKIIVDTYGGSAPHGGGAFSGKDASKVDRSAAYAARHVAKHIVAAGLADRCTVQLSYAIGLAEPVSIAVDLHGTGRTRPENLENSIRELFDLTPNGIIRTLDLRKPVYEATAAYGHFGRPEFAWEQLNPEIIQALSKILN